MNYNPLPICCTIRPSWIEGLGVFAVKEIRQDTELGVSHIEFENELYRTPLGGFINHSDKFADYVSFILPQLFESDGKGVPRKRVIGFNLVHSEKITTLFESPKGDPIKVQCIFQIWSKNHVNFDYTIVDTDVSVVKIYSLSHGSTPSTTRNKKMLYKCHAYIPSTCFGKNNMKYYSCFDDLPGRKGYGVVFNENKTNNLAKFKSIDWSEVAFLSTNSAYNIRTSQITAQFV